MHARQLAEIGGWLAICSEMFTKFQITKIDEGLKYWAASKCRVQRWQAALKVFEHDLSKPTHRHDPWPAIRVVVQEILVSDLLTRIWTMALIEQDQTGRKHDLQGIGHSVFISHLEIRNRALRLLVEQRNNHTQAVDELDELRQRLERWTDMLLSRTSNEELAARFCFDPHRLRDFSADRELENRRKRKKTEQILIASFKASLQAEGDSPSANPDLNREIASGVLGCLPADQFLTHGIPEFLLHVRMEQVQNDTQEMVRQLIDSEQNRTAC